jgi:hypothetical protein
MTGVPKPPEGSADVYSRIFAKVVVGSVPANALLDCACTIPLISSEFLKSIPSSLIISRNYTRIVNIKPFSSTAPEVASDGSVVLRVFTRALVDGSPFLASAEYTFAVMNKDHFIPGIDIMFSTRCTMSMDNPIGILFNKLQTGAEVTYPAQYQHMTHSSTLIAQQVYMQQRSALPFAEFVSGRHLELFDLERAQQEEEDDQDVNKLINNAPVTDEALADALKGADPDMIAGLSEILFTLRDVFKGLSDKPAKIEGVKVELLDPDQIPIDVGHHRMPHPDMQKGYNDQIEAWIAQKLVEASTSLWGAPLVCVWKPNGTVRVCVDLSRLNAVIKKYPYVSPNMRDLLNKVKGCKYFSSFDLQQGFMNIEIPPEMRKFFAFHSTKGKLQFTRMPFGFVNASFIFQRAMERILAPLISIGVCVVYLDDILIATKTAEEHKAYVKEALRLLHEANFRVNLAKSKLGRTEISYLGFILDGVTYRVDQSRLQPLRDMVAPKSLRQLRSFLGLANYHRDFIPNLADLAKPLDELNVAGTRITSRWTSAHTEAFEAIKNAILADVSLYIPSFDAPFILHTDASDYAIGAVLLQADASGKHRPVSYYSRKLTDAERIWGVGEKEALALVTAIRKFEHFLFPRHFEVWTDHKNLKWLHDSYNPKVLRWIMYLLKFDFTISYFEGNVNVVADALSRVGFPEEPISQIFNVLAATTRGQRALSSVPKPTEGGGTPPSAADHESTPDRPDPSDSSHARRDYTDIVKEHTATSSWIQRVIAAQHSAEDAEVAVWHRDNRNATISTTHGDVWTHDDCIIIPKNAKDLQRELLNMAHDHLGHGGSDRTYRRLIQSRTWWHHMRNSIADHVSKCPICQRTKAPADALPVGPMLLRDPPRRPWERITLDYLGPFPVSNSTNMQYILVIVDQLTRWCEMQAVDAATGINAANVVLHQIIYRHGVPSWIYSDGAKALCGKEMDKLCEQYCINQHIGMAYHPQSQGVVERLNRTIMNHLLSLVHKDRFSWDKHVPRIRWLINTSYNRSIRMTPYEALHGIPPCSTNLETIFKDLHPTPIDLSHLSAMCQTVHDRIHESTKQAESAAKRYYDQKHAPVDLKIGSHALIFTPVHDKKLGKLTDRWQGPVQVVAKVNESVYTIQRVGGLEENVSVQRLKPFDMSRTTVTDELARLLNPGEYIVEDILRHKISSTGEYRFDVKWQGIPELLEGRWSEPASLRSVTKFKEYCSKTGIPLGSNGIPLKPVSQQPMSSASS